MAPRPVLTLSREEMRSRALAFAKRWQGPQREESEAKSFLDGFFDVFGRDRQAVEAVHEYRIERLGQSQARIDLLWPGKLMVEMKSTGRDLSDHPGGAARQAFDYLHHLDPEERPQWVLISDFANFHLYDLGEDPGETPHGRTRSTSGAENPTLFASFRLEDLPDRLNCFAFIRGDESESFQPQPEVNLKAVKLLGSLHDELKKFGFAGHDLECFLVRTLFCLFAEDTGIFDWNQFTRFIESGRKDGSDTGERLGKLFRVLATEENQRSVHLTSDFRAFPYINGGLFRERLDPPDTAATHRAALLACCRFDWSRISPSVFGSLFQGVMEPVERRAKGAHYTSEENIRKVIDSLFLDDLKEEFARLKNLGSGREKKLQQFHDKLARLRFLDPACGCGNFLVVAYRELRALELDLLHALHGKQLALRLEVGDIARVNVDQLYGIEIEEFPARIAETALWLTDHQVNMTFSKAFGRLYTRIPLSKSPTILHANALRTDWAALLPPKDCSYLLGNPPFIGAKYMDAAQRSDMELVAGKIKNYGLLDFVTAWHVKSADYIQGTRIRCAFVSTNSISQGEQVAVLWSHLFAKGVKIHFAHRTFVWDNEASGKAHVHVVIIGFGMESAPQKRLFDYDKSGKATASTEPKEISPYLTFGSSTVVSNRSKPLCQVPAIQKGCQPTDDGNFLFDADELKDFLKKEPLAKRYIRRFVGAQEFINSTGRWCLWLADAPVTEWRKLPEVVKRVEAVRDFRVKSKKAATVEKASTPYLFDEIRVPETDYLLIPSVSSELRPYIPIGQMSRKVIPSNLVMVLPRATLYHFGILTSTMHMAWMRTVAGRLESRYRYSNKLVYNNYPWPEPTKAQTEAIKAAAQNVLDAREPHLDNGATLADLYDPLTMPAPLVKAHNALDRAVERAYRKEPFRNEREQVEFLFELYERLTSPLTPPEKPRSQARV
jgi:hypothetical protein